MALGWIGEPALPHPMESLLGIAGRLLPLGLRGQLLPRVRQDTALHIVLGELAPKSFALQRSESYRPLERAAVLPWPATVTQTAPGNLLLRLRGLHAVFQHPTP